MLNIIVYTYTFIILRYNYKYDMIVLLRSVNKILINTFSKYLQV